MSMMVAAQSQSLENTPKSIDSGPQSAAAVSAGQQAQTPAPLTDFQDPAPTQDPSKQSVEAQLADLRKEVAGLKAVIESIANNESLPPDVRLQAIRAAVTAQPAAAPAQAAAPVASQPAPAPAVEVKPEPKPATAQTPLLDTDPLAALDLVGIAKKAVAKMSSPAADPTAALDGVAAVAQPSPAKPNAAQVAIDPTKSLPETSPLKTESKPNVATAPVAPSVAEVKSPEVAASKVEPKPSPATLTPELAAKALAIGTTLANDYSITSIDYRKIVQKAELEAAKVEMDPASRKLFNEAIVRTFAEKTLRTNERHLADFSERSSGSDIESSMRYNVMGRILGEGNSDRGNKQAGQILKEIAQERIAEKLSEQSTYGTGPENVKIVSGLAKRFKLEAPVDGIKNELQETRQSALDEFRAVLGSEIDSDQKERLLRGIQRDANKGEDVVTEKELAPLFSERIVEELESSRGRGIDERRKRLESLTHLAETFDVEDDPAVKAALTEMKLEVSGELLDKGIDEILNNKKLSWSQTADALEDLRDAAVELSGVKEKEANRVIEERLKEYVASRDIASLAHAREIMSGIEEIDSELGLSDTATEEMKASVRRNISARLNDLLAEDIKKVDAILLADKPGKSLDFKETAARNFIAEVAKVGDDKLAQEIKVVLGAHAVGTILDGDIKNKADLETRADEAEDLAHKLGIKPEAAQVVARSAEKRFGRAPESEADIKIMKEELYELMEESYLRPKDTRDSNSTLLKDATERLVALDKELDKKLESMQESAREKARVAAEAARQKAFDDVKSVLSNDSLPIEQRIAEIRKIQEKGGIPEAEVKKLVETKVDELAQRNDRRSTASAAVLARNFRVEML